jgi:hypothetical protein
MKICLKYLDPYREQREAVSAGLSQPPPAGLAAGASRRRCPLGPCPMSAAHRRQPGLPQGARARQQTSAPGCAGQAARVGHRQAPGPRPQAERVRGGGAGAAVARRAVLQPPAAPHWPSRTPRCRAGAQAAWLPAPATGAAAALAPLPPSPPRPAAAGHQRDEPKVHRCHAGRRQRPGPHSGRDGAQPPCRLLRRTPPPAPLPPCCRVPRCWVEG